ncbi:MAG: MFS transporter [Archaeoglobaceae archaeon]|nr:MFS transporter [Archaeoglobaceae archaeon]
MDRALQFVLLMGIVSLLADTTYEGARSVIGAYLATFGTSALLLGLIIGIGEFLSYGFRVLTGYFADRYQKYWFFAFLGYVLVLSIPFIALTDSLGLIFLLIILERIGKAFRSPSRDALLSFATVGMGRGIGFGIHEALDQVGAFLGPFIFFFVLYLGYSYRDGFLLLFIPSSLMLLALLTAKHRYFGEEILRRENDKLGKKFWIYIIFTILSVAGLANFQILAYHFKVKAIIADELIPLLYALAMAVDALVAVLAGKTYDRVGLKSLIFVPILTPISAFLSLHYNPVLGLIFLGSILGIHESAMRAGVAELSGAGKRATAYGFLNMGFGIGFFIGSFTIGFLYEISYHYIILFSICIEILAFLILFLLFRQKS